MTSREIKQIIQEADTNNDGRINYREVVINNFCLFILNKLNFVEKIDNIFILSLQSFLLALLINVSR